MTDRRDEVIRSSSNPTIKRVRSLQRRKGRDTERAFVVEGRRAVGDALESGAVPSLVLIRAGDEELLSTLAVGSDVVARRVAPGLFDELCDTVSPQGLLGVFPFPELPIATRGTPLILVVDGVRDPGNLGTLLRSATGAGATLVYLGRGSVDAYHPKVVRSAMAAHFRVPIRPLDPAARRELTASCPTRVVADAAAAMTYEAVDWTGPAALIVGSEAEGVGAETAALATAAVAIPLAANVESLNAAVAGAIVLFEAARQRRMAGAARGDDGRLAGEGTP